VTLGPPSTHRSQLVRVGVRVGWGLQLAPVAQQVLTEQLRKQAVPAEQEQRQRRLRRQPQGAQRMNRMHPAAW